MAADMLRSAGLRCGAVPVEVPGPPPLTEGPRSVLLADGVRCGLELDRLPGRPVGLGWLHTVLSAAAEFDAAIHLVPVDVAAAHRAVERRMRNLTADRLLEMDRGRIGDAAVDAGLEAAASLRDRLVRNEVRPVRLSIVVTVRGDTESEAHHCAEIVRAAAAGAGLRLRHTHLCHGRAVRRTDPAGETATAGKLVELGRPPPPACR